VDDDPLARLRSTREVLPDRLRQKIMALGPTAVPHLIEILNDEELAHVMASGGGITPGQGWPPSHAAELLVDLKAVEAIEPMIRRLIATGIDAPLHETIAERLPELGAAVLEPASAVLAEVGEDHDKADVICDVMRKLGVKDDRVFAALMQFFERDPGYGAMVLANYGDPRALPRLLETIATFEPNFKDRGSRAELLDLMTAFEDLDGELAADLQARLDEWLGRWDPPRPEPPVRTAPAPRPTVGRNDPCPCGSGKKWKKCCIDKPQPTRES
jgi:HEAT repeat protein